MKNQKGNDKRLLKNLVLKSFLFVLEFDILPRERATQLEFPGFVIGISNVTWFEHRTYLKIKAYHLRDA